MFDAAVARAQPATCLPPHLPPPPKGRLIVLACGKSGAQMSEVCEGHYLGGGLLQPERMVGICITRHGYGRPLKVIRCVEAGHPVPDAAGLKATADVLALAGVAGPDDLALVLLSGGGSANWVAPAAGLSIDDKQRLTKALLASGAPISDINTVRKHLSRIKGGRLAARLYPARSLSLAISDVPGDDPSLIASGPTVPDPNDRRRRARRASTLEHPDTRESARRCSARPDGETPKPGDRVFSSADYRIVARPADSLEAAAAIGRSAGYEVAMLGDAIEGEASAVGSAHGRMAIDALRAGKRDHPPFRRRADRHRAGATATAGPTRNTRWRLRRRSTAPPGITALAADTDGTDGGRGAASDPAGAFADATSVARGKAQSLNAANFLKNNDSKQFINRIGDLLVTGPTGTNVNDFRCVVVDKGNAGGQ